MTTGAVGEWRYPGSRWWKFDFRSHTPASADYGKGPDQASLRQIAPEDWLLGYMRAGVDCVAITDHNSGEWIDRLKTALRTLEQQQHDEFRPLHLFPGVEVTANGGIHVLAVFDTDRGSSEVDRLLGEVGYQGDTGASDVAAREAPIGVVEAICNQGGIPILAHVDGPSGAWRLPGNTLGPLLECNGLFAMEVVDPDSERPDLYQQRRIAWAEVLGSDAHHPSGGAGDRFPGSHFTWVKMAEPTLEGLRLALLDGRGFSIRRSDDPEPFDPTDVPNFFVEAIEIANAQYMGRGGSTRIEFSPWLNALVGGRGTGKSTVVHALRIASRREGDLTNFEDRSEPRLTFNQFRKVPRDRTDKGGLTFDTTITWTLMRDGVRLRVHWPREDEGPTQDITSPRYRTAHEERVPGLHDAVSMRVSHSRTFDAPMVEKVDDVGKWSPSSIAIVTPEHFSIRILSQGQIAALAGEDQRSLLQLIDEAAGVGLANEALKATSNGFFAARARVRELEGRLARRGDLVVKREDVERKLKRFEDAGHTSILTTLRHRRRQHREVERQFEVAEASAERIDEVAETLLPEDLPEGLFDETSPEDPQAISIIATLAGGIRDASQALRDTALRLRETVAKQREDLAASAWQTEVDRAENEYERLVEALRAEGVTDQAEYGRLTQDRQSLDGELGDLDSLSETRDSLAERSTSLLTELLAARREVSATRDAFLTDKLASNRFVRIGLRAYGEDPRVIERSLREVLGVNDDRFERDIYALDSDGVERGCVADLLSDLPEDSAERRSVEIENRIEDLKRRFSAACAGRDEFGGHFNNFLARESGRSPGFSDKLLTWFPEDALQVEYSRTGDGADFRPIGQASAGQRSAAMLAFLLAYGEEPLVLDQPEDDLDNHLIYDLVVRQMRENKCRRQIIVVTHNPNIVVNGDAEMLHVLDFRGGQCRVVQAGSLQQEAIREEVCRVMEGGREAFERRYRRLGREPHRV